MTSFIVVLLLMLAAGLWAVVSSRVILAAIALAATSALLTIAMYQMGAPLAAAMELSVCAGLITVVFVSTISLTHRQDDAVAEARMRGRRVRFYPLFAVVAALAAVLWAAGLRIDAPVALAEPVQRSVREVLWIGRRFDLVGQIVLIFAGVFGIVALFKRPGRLGKGAE